MEYQIKRCQVAPRLRADWNDPAWLPAEIAEVSRFHPQSSAHHPHARARVMADRTHLHGIFQVADRYVRCVRANYFDDVWKDSCVEFFLQPKPGRGYFNFEFNCGGAHLCDYITDWTLKDGWFAEAVKLPSAIGGQVQVKSTLPQIVDPEIKEAVDWTLQFTIPLTVLEEYVGPLGDLSGQTWRGNFFKCAEEVSHPHWAAWSPVEILNFHQPECFGTLKFD